MSCRAMGGPFGSLTCGGVIVFGIFSLGPNVLVGAVGCVASLGIVAIEEVKATFFEHQIKSKLDNPTEQQLLLEKIETAKKESQSCKKAAKAFAVCTIPVIGPFGAVVVASSGPSYH